MRGSPHDRARTRLPDHPRTRRVRLHPARRQPRRSQPATAPTSGDITGCHDATITSDTIIPNWNGDKLDLDHAIWVAFANARLTAA
jgi:hypothetical protein